MPNDGDLVDLLSEWIDDADTLKQILVTNPREVYGPFGGAGR
jgi:predicted TIM-barrel fold metal-dependent hydrolase